MTFLPIVQRELRAAARRRGTYRVRLAMAATAVLVGGGILILTVAAPPQRAGLVVFQVLAGLALGFCLLYGRQATADCLSSEKREGTLGLLFLTDLKGHDVVLGKIAATSLPGFYGLMAIFPVIAVPLLMGGVTSGEFWRIVAVLIVTFLFSLGLGVFVSALSRDARRALGANLLVMLLIIGVPPAVGGIISSLPGPGLPAFYLSCPVYGFHLAFDAQYKASPHLFWGCLAVIHGLTWLLVILASRIVPNSWQDRPVRNEHKAGFAGRWRAWACGKPEARRRFRQRLLTVNAFYWLAARVQRKPDQVWIFLALVAAWWFIAWGLGGQYWVDTPAFIVTALLVNTTLKIWLAIEAGQQLAEERRIGSLEFLLSTPLTVREILHGQWRALFRQFGAPVLAVVALECLFAAMPRRPQQSDPAGVVFIAGVIMLIADLFALGWLGMWHGLTSKSHPRATYATITRILVLPWLLLGICSSFIAVWSALARGVPPENSAGINFGLWFGIGILTDVGFGLWARWKLHHSFREAALRQVGVEAPGTSLGKSLLSMVATSLARPPATGAVQKVDENRHEGAVPNARRRFRRRLATAASALLLLSTFAWWTFYHSKPAFPPATPVALGTSNTVLQVSLTPFGFVAVLPDGTMWRWGRAATPSVKGTVSEQIGTNTTWVKAISSGSRTVGLTSDGKLWEWSYGHEGQPQEIHSGQSWLDFGYYAGYFVALRRDGTLWEEGDSVTGLPGTHRARYGKAGKGVAGTAESRADEPRMTLTQLTTNQDWAAISAGFTSILALRQDGTLWAWGRVYDPWAAQATVSELRHPTRVCRESNWAGFIGGMPPMIITTTGELWELRGTPPEPDGAVTGACRLVETNCAAGRVVSGYGAGRKLFRIQEDGTLWERGLPWSPPLSHPATPWRKVGLRSDWVSLHGAGPMTVGLTGDGTVWMWGYDPTQKERRVITFSDIQARVGAAMGGTAPGFSPGYRMTIQEEPRPAIRLMPKPTGTPR